MFDLLCFLNKFNSNDLLWNTTRYYRVCVLFAFYLLKTGEQRLLIRVSGRETPRSTIKTFIKVLKKHTEHMSWESCMECHNPCIHNAWSARNYINDNVFYQNWFLPFTRNYINDNVFYQNWFLPFTRNYINDNVKP